ncbi:MarR family transcriptional regulator [Paenibacillus sp. SSG-1]|uniref:MarR family winged helix-turn-helix transcriptional regulator n=1 Tax=Paenibacillus sp. SSG-1 TaxID=1443669 RepID=UPI000B7F85D3|nr:MarR family winged helix-turn-helix transcriptional regulator [Paenibacillus sp. SSG-1]OXL86809.1 MarR family transcriptional regulator [Paenibacillus sp. SSG-1]
MDENKLFDKFIAFTAAVHQVKHEMTQGIKPEGITPVQYSMLEYIAVSQPVTLSQISDCQQMSMPNTSREIKKLCDKQLCEKYDDPSDRRKQYVRLSGEGDRVMKEAFGHIGARFLTRLQDASEKDLQEIVHAMDVLHSRVFYTDK